MSQLEADEAETADVVTLWQSIEKSSLVVGNPETSLAALPAALEKNQEWVALAECGVQKECTQYGYKEVQGASMVARMRD